MAIHVWGTDFRRNSCDLRTQLFIPENEREDKLSQLRELGFQDILYLHTCNRVEFYTTSRGHYVDTRPQWFRLLAHLGAKEEDFYRGYHFEGKSAVRHLLRLSCSLESMVIGEPQILGQLKGSLQWAREHGFPISSELESSFQFAFETAKKVRTETPIGARSISVATVGMEKLSELTESWSRIALVGRSPMVLTAARWLRKRQPDVPVLWVSRSPDELARLPEAEGAETLSLTEFLKNPPLHSHLITATSSPEPLFGPDFFNRAKTSIALDFAQPPDVDRNQVQNIQIIQIEDLRQFAKENERMRQEATFQAERIIEKQLQKFYLLKKEAPVLKEFSSVETEVFEALKETLQQLDEWVPGEVVPKLRDWAEKLVKRNLHTSRKHLREALRKTAAGSFKEPHTH